MLPRIFIDTSAFLALEDESDHYHDKAFQFREQVLRKGSYEVITTWLFAILCGQIGPDINQY